MKGPPRAKRGRHDELRTITMAPKRRGPNIPLCCSSILFVGDQLIYMSMRDGMVTELSAIMAPKV